MKKFIITMMGLLVVLSCGQKPSSSTDNDDEEEDTEVVNTKKERYSYDEDKVEVSIQVDFPRSGGHQLVQALGEFISEKLGGTYDGDLTKGKEMVKYYGRQLTDQLKTQREEEKENIDEEYINGYYKKVTISKLYETEKLITFDYSEDLYLNGAHGMEYNYGVTFRKSDGRRFGTEMMKDLYSDGMHSLIKEGLREYFSEGGGAVSTDEELKEYILTDDDVNYLPLPKHGPYVTRKGVQFTYQPYEISFYAAGMPQFTVSLKRIKPYLNNTAKEMLFSEEE